jgi:hypothetical protein
MKATLEELRLMKPTGFTSKWADLGKTTTYRIATPHISYDHSGPYGEFSEFEYSRLMIIARRRGGKLLSHRPVHWPVQIARRHPVSTRFASSVNL